MYTNDVMTQRETELMAQVAAMTQERDAWHADASSHLRALVEMRAELNGAEQQLAASQVRCAQYDELIMTVASKYPNETRRQTALRYIKERENRCDGPVQASTERPPT